MKKMKIKTLFLLSTIMTFLLFLPILANADAVPSWSTETYRAYAYSQYNSEQDQEEVFGPPLPISVYASTHFGIDASSSSITSSEMNIWSHAEPTSVMFSANSDAVAEFSGTFTAVAPVFQFTYAYTYHSYGWAAHSGNDEFWISVYDATDSVSLYNETLNFTSDGSASDVLNINIQSGHEINVNFGILVKSSLIDIFQVDGAGIDLTYGMALVPEPDVAGCIDMKGVPVAGQKVILKQKNELNKVTTTDANGCYEFPTAVSGKTFKVIINGPMVP